MDLEERSYIRGFTESKLQVIEEKIDRGLTSDGRMISRGLLAIAYSIHEFSQVISTAVEQILKYRKNTDW